MKRMTLLAENLMNRTLHESDGRTLWTFFHIDEAGEYEWHVSDETPVLRGRDANRRVHVDVNVKETFDDVAALLESQRQNGFHSWKKTI